MRIRGAVLSREGADRPYVSSHPLQMRELDLDAPGTGEILVRIEAAGLCHSDLSVINGDRSRPLPMLLGHEASGRVVELGDGVVDLAVGDRVVMTFLPRCGRCRGCMSEGRIPCEPGSAANGAGTLLSGAVRLHDHGEDVLHHLGVSAFATAAVVDRRSVVRVDDDVPAEVAALLGCAILTGGGAVFNAAPPSPGDRVVVVGLGGVGMSALLAALAIDGVDVVGVDLDPAKRETASRLGASRALAPQEAIGEGLRGDVVVEAAGAAAAFETAITLTAPGGTTVTVGLPRPEARVPVSPLALVAEGRRIVGSYLGSAVPERDIPRYVDLWRRGLLPIEELISDRLPFDEINRGMDRLADGHAIRQVIDMTTEGDHR
ncbi:alcohol dehydrogenase [Microbacterium sp. AG1240]|uniref:alcohol dehydrogenase catalytic domain-containing protein n=1 Tax=Microbacterium sp. AG1240 TaxID=2183992 RepID=UPI000EAF3B14|nr:alcohol dehydrogenase catalytic domain-containing protein [Microbacterium sp. AG1240]RKT31472.1 alcohol dehydrogenase [Microbacterium sp. AG1240]